MSELSCKSCNFSRPTENKDQFHCMHKPPTVFLIPIRGIGGESTATVSVFPPVTAGDWCSNHPLLVGNTVDDIIDVATQLLNGQLVGEHNINA